MPIHDKEKQGIEDLLIKEEQNIHILFKLANSVTGNVVDVESAQEALDYICTHMRDCQTLLNKKNITKEVLFRYLHSKRVPVAPDFTKTTLINKVIEYWLRENKTNANTTTQNSSLNGTTHQNTAENQSTIVIESQVEETEYPINLLARKFSEWFFQNYNKSTLKIEDFWSDARLVLRIAATDRIDDQECIGATGVLETLLRCKQQFEFYFNPNLTHAGVQGRMDVHGLVLVLSCGTLHTQVNCVGIFECTFGLMRDPFAENNWKMKTIQMMLRSQGILSIPSLCDSDSLRDALTLPVPMGDFS